MSTPCIFRTINLIIALALILAACSPSATPTSEPIAKTEAPAAPKPTPLPSPTPTADPTATPGIQIGSTEHPIKILFIPSVDAERIVPGAQLLVAALNKATGLSFEIVVPISYAVVIEEMCTSPHDTIGLLPGPGYVLAEQLCGVKVAGKAVRFGYDWYAAMIVVARDSVYQTIADLNGKKWAYPDGTSISSYLYPLYMFREAGIMPGESVAAGSHDAAIKAVYNGEADFGTAFFSPPRLDGKAVDWQPGQNPDVPADLLDSCRPTQDEKALVCGNFEIRDARRNLRKELPDVAQKVRILVTTPKIPNDTVSFGPDFPEDLMQKIMDALFAFAQNDPEGFAKALEAYSWTGINPATDAEYDPIRFAIQASGFKIEDLGQ